MPSLKTSAVLFAALALSGNALAQVDAKKAEEEADATTLDAQRRAQAHIPQRHHDPRTDAAPVSTDPIVLVPMPGTPVADPSPPAPLSTTPQLQWDHGPPAFFHDIFFARTAWDERIAVPPIDHPQQWREVVWDQGGLWLVVQTEGAPDQLLCLQWQGPGGGIAREECQPMPAGRASLSFQSPDMRDWAGGTYLAQIRLVPDEDAAMDEGESVATLSLAAARRPNTSAPVTHSQAPLPSFPWPPPKPTSKTRIDNNLLVAANGTLGDVADRLERALHDARYETPAFYAIPGGFAVATRMEQIESDGTPVDEATRWSTDLPPRRITSLGDYLKALFAAPEGHYRVIVFSFTDQPVATAPVEANEADAQAWISAGVDRLPEAVANRPYTLQHRCLVLVYEFKKVAGNEAIANPDDAPAASVHLERSGILAALQQP